MSIHILSIVILVVTSQMKSFLLCRLAKTTKWQLDVLKMIFEFKRYFCHVMNFLLHFAKTSLVKKRDMTITIKFKRMECSLERIENISFLIEFKRLST